MSWLTDHSTLERERERERQCEHFYRAEEWVIHQKLGQCLGWLPGGSQRQWEAKERGGWEVNGTPEWGKLWAAANKEVSKEGPLRTNLPHDFPQPGSVHVNLYETSTVPPCSMSTWEQKGNRCGEGWGGSHIILTCDTFLRLLQNLCFRFAWISDL